MVQIPFTEEINEIRPPKGFTIDVKELWQYRELIYIFSWRDITSKYKQTIFGFLWAVVQPLSMMLLFTLFFSGTLKISTDNIPAPIFYFSGLLIWNFFSAAITNASNSMVTNGHIIKKIYFPRLILPLSYVLIALFDFVIALGIFFLLLIFYVLWIPDFSFQVQFLLFYPVAILIVILSSFGIGSILAALNVRFRDVRLTIGFLIQLLFFLTPVIYPVSVFKDEGLRWLLALNPASSAVKLMRAPFVEEAFPTSFVLVGGITSVLLFAFGIYLFRKAEYYFADLV
ncbi:MAG: ABC transporter permease [Saprospiraceae bacterium]|nr:ABC transporter permease [Saprospiraceae bacterium]